MKGEIIVKEIKDEEETRLWFYKEGNRWLCLNEALEEDILEVEFLDEEKGVLLVFYSNWDSMELYALMDIEGNVRMTGISTVEEYIKDHELLIVTINSSYADEDMEHDDYNDSDEIFWTVLDIYGSVKIDSTQSPIKFYDDENIFVIERGDNEQIIPLSEVIDR